MEHDFFVCRKKGRVRDGIHGMPSALAEFQVGASDVAVLDVELLREQEVVGKLSLLGFGEVCSKYARYVAWFVVGGGQ